MNDFNNFLSGLAIFIVIVLFIILFSGPFIDLNSRIEKLEKYHFNVCPECGQILDEKKN